MEKRFFFITTYDNISGTILASIVNSYPDFHCNLSSCDPFIRYENTASLDEFITSNSHEDHRFHGNVQQFSAHELQSKMLMERTRHPIRKINLVISPVLRINLLLKSWLEVYKNANEAVKNIEHQIKALCDTKHPLMTDYRFPGIFHHIKQTAKNKGIDTNIAVNKLFIIALARVIAQDFTDLLSSNKNVCLETLLHDENECLKLLNYLGSNQINIHESCTALKQSLQEGSRLIAELSNIKWEIWQTDLFQKYLHFNLQAISFQHTNKPVASFYHDLGYKLSDDEKQPYSKLISIHLNSNRPAQLALYFDNIEETTDDPNLVEILVNCDDHDLAMQEMLEHEIKKRKFTIKYITSPRPVSFCDLWKPINSLLTITDPNAYFLVNISDEMLFATHGWDTILKKYVGFFPDNIFRLRASRNKFRNYFDRWECSFAQDSIPITTKKWVDIGGDWNPCFGPDSFQQLIAFYLAQDQKFSANNLLRELPLLDIKFHGDVPFVGIAADKAWKHNRDHILAMQICQSHPMQQEAKRRAMLLKAHIAATDMQLHAFNLVDDKKKRIIYLVNIQNNEIIQKFDYSLNWFSITLTNQLRKLRFYAYFGGGKAYGRNMIFGFAAYLAAIYPALYRIRGLLKNKQPAEQKHE